MPRANGSAKPPSSASPATTSSHWPRAAAAAGASYVAFGSFFPSTTKPKAVRPDPGLLTEARRRVALPLVAIGGITPHNGGSLIAAGADMLAVVTGVFAQADIAAAARAYTNLFPKETH
jgi:thiamine-phosphate pyrophosphorylase